MTRDVEPDATSEPSILARVRPATWTPAQQVQYEHVMRLVDQALAVCSHHEERLRDGDLMSKADAARWRALYDELTRTRAALRPGQASALQELRARGEELLEANSRLVTIQQAIGSGEAVPFTSEQNTVYYAGAWWLRDGLSYRQLDPASPAARDFHAALGPRLTESSAANAAVRRWRRAS